MTEMKKKIEVDSSEKKDFEIDWQSVMDDDGGGKEDEVPELEIVNATTQPRLSDDQTDFQESLTDFSLEEQLERNKAHLVKFGPHLPDKGEKIRLKIASLEEEKQRRVLRRSKMELDGSLKLMNSKSSGSDVSAQGNIASKDSPRQDDLDSKEVSRSTFADCFSKPKPDTHSTKAFGKELEDLGCESGKQKAYKKIGTRPKNRWLMVSEVEKAKNSEKQFYSGSKGLTENPKPKKSFGKKKPNESSAYSLRDDDDNDSNGHETSREWYWEEYPPQSSKRFKKSDDTLINVDDEEPQPSTMVEQAFELPEGLQEDICYPSSDDPDSVQVCRKDLECLAPQEFLNSTIMNFYIRFLQQQVSSTNQNAAGCHFFNTYFYKKLNDAVTYKGNDKDAFFVKFRRWWKGIDLFRKAYIFIPIHEDLHWSLVIVCIPDKEDESELIILHLDSLGLHSRRSVVENVKRFLKEEWKYLNQDEYSSDLPFSERLWKNLPRRISDADVQVPQQKNDSDCGPFVLFFIKRFMEEAPKRLKKKDLGMFDKKWFRPDEASALRIKIRSTLIDLFRVSNQTDCRNDQTDETCIDQRTSDGNAASKLRQCSQL